MNVRGWSKQKKKIKKSWSNLVVNINDWWWIIIWSKWLSQFCSFWISYTESCLFEFGNIHQWRKCEQSTSCWCLLKIVRFITENFTQLQLRTAYQQIYRPLRASFLSLFDCFEHMLKFMLWHLFIWHFLCPFLCLWYAFETKRTTPVKQCFARQSIIAQPTVPLCAFPNEIISGLRETPCSTIDWANNESSTFFFFFKKKERKNTTDNEIRLESYDVNRGLRIK